MQNLGGGGQFKVHYGRCASGKWASFRISKFILGSQAEGNNTKEMNFGI